MQTPEEKRERVRAYYQANKDKWKKYNKDIFDRMTPEELAEYKERQREWSREYYQRHREQVIQRTTKYNKENKDKLTPYRAKWSKDNGEKIAARRREQYHAVVKPRRQKAKETSEFVTVSQAVAMLGAKLRTFREWVYQGRIPAVKTPTGRYMLRRADVEEIRTNINQMPEKIKKTLGLKRGEA